MTREDVMRSWTDERAARESLRFDQDTDVETRLAARAWNAAVGRLDRQGSHPNAEQMRDENHRASH